MHLLICNTYKPGHPETEAAYMGCRTRVVANHYDPTREIVEWQGEFEFYFYKFAEAGNKK